MTSYVGYVNEDRVTDFLTSQARVRAKLNERIPALLKQGYSEVKEHSIKHPLGSVRSFSCEGKEDVELVIAVFDTEG